MRANLTKHGGEYSITTARTVGGTRRPRTTTVALTDCVCYKDGEVINVIPRTHNPKTAKSRSRTPRAPRITTAQAVDIALMSRMGSIHESDQ
jgi:hypothetical protein